MLVLEGMPLLLLELGIGQKMRTGSFGVWNRVHPYLGGIGIGSTVVAVIVGCYYNAIIAWCIFYLFKSFNVSFCTHKSHLRNVLCQLLPIFYRPCQAACK